MACTGAPRRDRRAHSPLRENTDTAYVRAGPHSPDTDAARLVLASREGRARSRATASAWTPRDVTEPCDRSTRFETSKFLIEEEPYGSVEALGAGLVRCPRSTDRLRHHVSRESR